jgi:hypothetical protein
MRIVAMYDRAEQGQHRPFRCRADNSDFYYVKGASVGFHGLCCEWIGGRLAQEIGLPVPPFGIVEVPPALIGLRNKEDQLDLGSGPAFASQELSPATDYLFSDLDEVRPELKAQILLFDWWTCNIDRILGEKGGNPNLVWSGSPRQLFVIDHNLAFSADSILMSAFWEDHVFRDAYPWCDSYWQRCRSRLDAALARLPDIWNEMPEQWTENEAGLSYDEVEKILRRTEEPEFWRPIEP